MSAWPPRRVLDESRRWTSPWRPPGSRHLHADGFEFFTVGSEAVGSEAVGSEATLMAPGLEADGAGWVRGAVAAAGACQARSLVLTLGVGYEGADSARAELDDLGAQVVAASDVLALDLASASVDDAPGVVTVEVPDVGLVAEFERTTAAAWGYPPPTDAELQAARQRFTPGWFLAYRNEIPCGTAGFALSGQVARFWGAAVVPSARGNGVYRGLVAARVSAARVRGAGLALVHADPPSSPILRYLGFAEYGQRLTYRVPVRTAD